MDLPCNSRELCIPCTPTSFCQDDCGGPLTNISAESPDNAEFLGTSYYRDCSGLKMVTVLSALSQADANNQANLLGLQKALEVRCPGGPDFDPATGQPLNNNAVPPVAIDPTDPTSPTLTVDLPAGCTPPGGCDGDAGTVDSPSPGTQPPTRRIFFSNEQTCEIFCVAGGSQTFTLAAGAFIGLSQAIADQAAYTYACSVARQNIVCLGYLGADPQQQVRKTGKFPVFISQFNGKCCSDSPQNFFVQAAGVGPFSWSIVAGAIPGGMTPVLSTNGRSLKISGTPTTPGNSSFTIRVTNTRGGSAQQAYTIQAIGFTNGDLADMHNGEPYNDQLTAAGGDAPYTFSITDGTLPPGLSMSDSGAITGTPACTGDETINFTVGISDSSGTTLCEKLMSISCSPGTPCTITDSSPLTAFDQGQPYSFQLHASGGTAPFTWSLAGGSLPQGLSLASSGLISGTAALVNGNLDASFSVMATDAHGNTCTKAFTLPVLDYHNFPPGKHWRISGYFTGLIDASCCSLVVANTWQGEFNGQLGPASFREVTLTEAIGGNRWVTIILRAGIPGPEWWIQLPDGFGGSNSAWYGNKIGSNSGAKLDSPAGVYTLNTTVANSQGLPVCVAAPATLTIEEY